jgi:hypothetical protein
MILIFKKVKKLLRKNFFNNIQRYFKTIKKLFYLIFNNFNLFNFFHKFHFYIYFSISI